jgi:hypothetical protein
MLLFMIIVEVSKALGLQVIWGYSTSSLDMSEVAGQIGVSFSNAAISEGNVVLQGTLLQPVAGKLVHICYLPVRYNKGYVAYKVVVEQGHHSLYFIVVAQELNFDMK